MNQRITSWTRRCLGLVSSVSVSKLWSFCEAGRQHSLVEGWFCALRIQMLIAMLRDLAAVWTYVVVGVIFGASPVSVICKNSFPSPLIG